MSDPDYFTDGSHMLILGITGSKTDYGGKSALATWWADTQLRSRKLVIWANFKHDSVADVLDDFQEVGSVEELADAMNRGARRIVLTPTSHDWAAVSARLEAFVRELPPDMTKAVVLDEAPELDADAVLSFVRVHGNGANCKTLALAQSPTDVSNSIVKQCTPVWVGPITGSYQAWFRSHDLSAHFDHVRESHEPYHWTVMTGPAPGDRDHYGPVSEEYVV